MLRSQSKMGWRRGEFRGKWRAYDVPRGTFGVGGEEVPDDAGLVGCGDGTGGV